MLVDIIVFILCLLALFKGLSNGLVLAVFSLLSYFIGLAAALKLSSVVAVYLGNQFNVAQRWLPFVAFALVLLLVTFLVRLGAKVVEGFFRVAMLGWLNKLGGVILYLLIYLFIFSIILFYAEQLHVIRKETIASSITYSWLAPIGPVMIGWLAIIIPFFENMFTALKQFFGGFSS